MVIIAFNLEYIGGANGFVGIPLRTTLPSAWLVLALVAVAAWRFDGSRLGYAARACRDNAVTAAAMGIHVPWVKTMVFAAGGAIAGLGGGLRAHYILVQNAEDLGFFMSVNYVIFWVFGGSYTFWGALFGALSLTIVPELLRFSLYERYILYGAVVTAVLLLRPAGIVTRPRMGGRGRLLDRLAAMQRR
jgi:branched-chain amino acid transport system permease protein